MAGISFLFFIAMMFGVYARGHFGYFVLSTAFLVVFVFTVIGWWMQKRNAVEVFDRGLTFRRFITTWGELMRVERDQNGALKLTKEAKDTITIPKTTHALDDLEAYIRSRSSRK